MPSSVAPICGTPTFLREQVTDFLCDDEEGVFAIGLDVTDPSHAGGTAILFSGDDGFFMERWRFPAVHLDDLAEVSDATRARSETLCVRSRRTLVLRSRDAAPIPNEIPYGIPFRHPGLAASGAHFMSLIGPPEDNPAFTLMARAGEKWLPIYTASIYWLEAVYRVASNAISAVPSSERRFA